MRTLGNLSVWAEVVKAIRTHDSYFHPGVNKKVFVGDSVFGNKTDHVEPCVSLCSGFDKSSFENFIFNRLPCIGNSVYLKNNPNIVGIITGKHGGHWGHIMADFPKEHLNSIKPGDKILIECNFSDYSMKSKGINYLNIGNTLAKKILQNRSDTICVKKIIHSEWLGSGINSRFGFYDIDVFSKTFSKKQKASKSALCLGDIVALKNIFISSAPKIKNGFFTIGVVSHGDSIHALHGPGITPLFCLKKGARPIRLRRSANLGKILKIGRFR